jgi:CheY-like chemotaxis protein
MHTTNDGGAPAALHTSDGRPWRVLCVEDNPAAARALAEVVRPLARAVIAMTVADARVHIARSPIDAAVVDVHLPDGSGFDVLAELLPGRCALPALVLSAASDDDVLRAARRVGAFVARKPLHPPSLRAFLKRAWLADRGQLTLAVKRFAATRALERDDERLLRQALDGSAPAGVSRRWMRDSSQRIFARCGARSLATLLDRLLDEAIVQHARERR